MKSTHLLHFILLVFFSTSLLIEVSAQSNAREINLTIKNEKLPDALKRLEKASGYKCLFTYDDLNQYSVSTTIKTKSINDAVKV